MGNIGHEIFPHIFEFFKLRDIVNDDQCADAFFLAVMKCAPMELENALGMGGLPRTPR